VNQQRPLREQACMSPLVLRRVLRRSRRSVVALAVLAVLGAAVLAHHSMPAAMHGMPGMPTATVCLAVLAIGTVLLAARIAIAPGTTFPRFRSAERLRSLIDNAPRSAWARAGPIELQVLRL